MAKIKLKKEKDFTDELLDCVEQEASLECKNYMSCDSEIRDYEDYSVADQANEMGWIVNKLGHPICPKCQKKQIKK